MSSRPLFAASLIVVVDGYISEGGIINTKKLQVILDDMTQREQEMFEKEERVFRLEMAQE